MKAKKKELTFKSIPSMETGYTTLSITMAGHDPFGRPGYHVYVGGCGIGSSGSLKVAKQRLLYEALAYCQRRIREGQSLATHYQMMLDELTENGLQKETKR